MTLITGIIADSAGIPAKGLIEFSQVSRIDTGSELVTGTTATAQVVEGVLLAADGSPFDMPANPEGTAVRVLERLKSGRTFEWWTQVPAVGSVEYRSLVPVEPIGTPIYGPPPWLADVIQARDDTINVANGIGGIAVTAVTNATAGMDLVTGSQGTRIVGGVDGAVPGTGFTPTDAAGRPLWFSTNDTDGGPDRRAADTVAGAVSQPVDEPGIAVAVTAAGVRTVLEARDTDGGFTADAADLVRASVLSSRALVSPRVRATRGLYSRTRAGVRRMVADPARIVVHGESHAARPWTGMLATLTGGTVDNRAIGGMSGDMVALRQGGLVAFFAVTGGSIPASGPATLTQVSTLAWRINVDFTMPAVAVCDDGTEVAGVLSRPTNTVDNGQWTFTRTATGSVISTARVQVRSTDLDTYAEHLPIVLFGRNDWELIVNGVGVPGGDPISTAITATASIVESLQVSSPRVLLLGTINDQTYVRGTSGWQFVNDYLAELWRCWPDFALAPGSTLRDYIVSAKALTDAGLTPTAADTANMLNDAPAPQIMADVTHWSDAIHPGVAQFVYNALMQKGWLA